MYVIIIVNCLGYWQPRNLCSSAMFSDCLHSVHQYWQPGNLYCSTFRLSPQSSPLLAAQKPLALLFNIQTVSTVFTTTGSPETSSSIVQHSDCLHRNTSTGNPEKTSTVQHSDCLHRNTSTGDPEISIVQQCLQTIQEKHQQVMDWRRVLG